jgi:hypothetical protein
VSSDSLAANAHPEPKENFPKRRPLDGEALLEDMEPDEDDVPDTSDIPGFKPFGWAGNA